MRSFVAMLAAVLLTVTLTGLVVQPATSAPAQVTVAQAHPEATKTKKAKKPKATPSPSVTVTTPTPSPAPTKSAAEVEGDRWVQLALVAGGGLLGAVFAFFGLGALLRHGRKRRNR